MLVDIELEDGLGMYRLVLVGTSVLSECRFALAKKLKSFFIRVSGCHLVTRFQDCRSGAGRHADVMLILLATLPTIFRWFSSCGHFLKSGKS